MPLAHILLNSITCRLIRRLKEGVYRSPIRDSKS